MSQALKWIDLPPIWLAAFLLFVWFQGHYFSFDLSFGTWSSLLGGALVAVGLVLIAAALWEMRRHKTTPVPHLVPSALVTSGVFAWSRNPIYLGDAFVLTGLILRWDAVLSLCLVPVFVWVITQRFIRAEEKRCSTAFGEAFDVYRSSTRRWI